MYSKIKSFFLIIPLLLILPACESDVMDDFNDLSYNLVDHHGEPFLFPDDLKGTPVVMGFIFTNCPDICSLITANIYKVYRDMDDPGDTRFILVTFDPERDTPDVLNDFAHNFNMNEPPFQFLTGPADEIEEMMKRMGIRYQVSYSKTLESGEEIYFLNHTDKIMLLNENAQLVMEYGGSMTPTNIIIEDINKL